MTLSQQSPRFEDITPAAIAVEAPVLHVPPETSEERRARLEREQPEQHAKMARVAGYIAAIASGYDQSAIPSVMAEKEAAIRSNSSQPPPPNIREVIEGTLNSMAYNLELDLYRTEFPGHEPPPMPDYLLK
jgi:hypothetical protein